MNDNIVIHFDDYKGERISCMVLGPTRRVLF